MSAAFGVDLTWGATPIAAGRTRFRLWAPAAGEVTLALEGTQPIPMRRRADGWHEIEVDCAAGARYRYRLPDGTQFPDPASRAQDGDIDGASIVVDPLAYRWRTAEWRGRPWNETVLYELHVGLYGGYAGVAQTLPSLAALGVTAIELMPVAEFPGARNWGYDGVLPFAPEAAYGTPDDLKALIDRAHELRMMVFLDVVYNHFGPDGNWLGRYAPDFFRRDLDTPWGVAIDFREDAVKRFFTDNAVYWLDEYRLDGLRFDAVHAIEPRTWLEEFAAEVRARIGPGRHVHLVLENDDNSARLLESSFTAQWNDDFHHVLHVLLTGEADGYYGDYADRPAERLARALMEGFVYQGEPSPHRDGVARGEKSAHLPASAFVSFLQNHDQIGNRAFGDRLTMLAEPEALRAAIALQLLAPQIPLIFMGEEAGSRRAFLYFTSHRGELAVMVREGRRREFARFAAFADEKSQNRIPDPNAPETFEACRSASPAPDADAWRTYYRNLLEIRHRDIVPHIDSLRAVEAKACGPKAVMARWRLGDQGELILISNLSNEPVELPAGSLPETRPIFTTSSDLTGAVQFPPHATAAWIERPA